MHLRMLGTRWYPATSAKWALSVSASTISSWTKSKLHCHRKLDIDIPFNIIFKAEFDVIVINADIHLLTLPLAKPTASNAPEKGTHWRCTH